MDGGYLLSLLGWVKCLFLPSICSYKRSCQGFRYLSMILVAPLWPKIKWLAYPLVLLVEEPLKLIMPQNLLVQPYARKFHETVRFAMPSQVEPVKRLFCMAGIFKEITEVVACYRLQEIHGITTTGSGQDSYIGVLE